MPYGFYLRKNRRKFRKVKVQPKSPVVATYTYPKKYIIKKKTSFAKRVNQVIARNVENKYTASVTYKADVGTLTRNLANISPPTYTDTYSAFVWAPGNGVNGMFNIAQGTNIQQRIGNKIKLKRWIIKGMIQPNDTFNDLPANPTGGGQQNGISPNSFCGYVTIYFGRRMDNLAPVGNDLNKFYQNGATDITPLGKLEEGLYPINKDLYKVYFRRRFKVGTGSGFSGGGSTLVYDPAPTAPGANGFGLTKSFGFDVCKYIAKNKIISFDESDTTPQYDNIENLCIWATFVPCAGNLAGINPTSGTTTKNNTFYIINAMSYAEYEDA
jgi:hypothetical protein